MKDFQMKYLLLLAFVATASAINLIGRTQSAAARGKLTCNGKPAAGVRVKLYDSDNSILPGVVDTDDLMASGKTDSNGEYNLSGSTKEITGIEPYIAIYHDCNDGIKPCQRTFRVGIPSKYVTSGKTPKSTYEAGQLELAGKYPKEGRSCLN
ncbi:Transthyretin-like family protein [Teladorsagia circumcincta]|uniref:Transthyretin-like family protein n=2 Tax=Teladorsagia circumcincta TaxID=45464 RepID=A0A2G9V4F4_TELCI|nr:Transthyretin-like family protein [Teladorsagia circumcincta]